MTEKKTAHKHTQKTKPSNGPCVRQLHPLVGKDTSILARLRNWIRQQQQQPKVSREEDSGAKEQLPLSIGHVFCLVVANCARSIEIDSYYFSFFSFDSTCFFARFVSNSDWMYQWFMCYIFYEWCQPNENGLDNMSEKDEDDFKIILYIYIIICVCIYHHLNLWLTHSKPVIEPVIKERKL